MVCLTGSCNMELLIRKLNSGLLENRKRWVLVCGAITYRLIKNVIRLGHEYTCHANISTILLEVVAFVCYNLDANLVKSVLLKQLFLLLPPYNKYVICWRRTERRWIRRIDTTRRWSQVWKSKSRFLREDLVRAELPSYAKND